MTHRSNSVIAKLFTIVLLSGTCLAQVATGTPKFGSFGGGPFDTVNLNNLNVHFSIPVVHKAGRGLPFNYDLSYDNSVWYPVGVSGNQAWTPVNNWGWKSQTESAVGYVSYNVGTTKCFDDGGGWYWGQRISGYVYHDPWGVSHSFPISLTCGDGIDTAVASDGSGYTATFTNQIKNPSGQVFSVPVNNSSGAATATDANGNRITVSSGGVFTDTLNQAALTVAGVAPSPTTFTYTAPSGAAAAATMHYTSYNVKTNFNCSGISQYTATGVSLVSSITMPDGSTYGFSYEPTPGYSGYVTARIQQVTIPTGGTVAYSYPGGTGNIVCADGSTPSLNRTISPEGTWAYTRSINGTSSTTTITDPKTPGNQTVIAFQNKYETQRKVYQGAAAGTPLSTTVTCYNGVNVGTPLTCPTTTVTGQILRVTTFRYLPDSHGVVAETDSTYDQYGLIREVDEYDFGAVGGTGTAVPGSVLRKTITNYNTALGNNIKDRASSVVIKDAGDIVKASTTYTYDDPGTLTSTSGIPQHVAVTGSRGNLTSVAAQANGTTTLYRTFTYYDLGTLKTSTDVSTSSTDTCTSNPSSCTTYNYALGSASCNSTFPTSISGPLSLSRSMTWNCVGGVLTSLTDENGHQSSTSYTDPYYWRSSSSTDAAGNTTTFAYSPNANTSLPTQTESTLQFNGNNSVVDVLTTVDGFGRALLHQRKQSPNPGANYDTTETDYDIAGCGVSRATLPYSATQGQTNPSAPGTSTAYDGACRPKSITDSGGGLTSYDYWYNDTYQTIGPQPSGETDKRKQMEYAGPGWLKSVCEITSGTVAAPAGTCSQSFQQTGYWTTYTYDTLGNQSGVTQNAQAAVGSRQSRTFVYDMLSRLISETNPETNKLATAYYYDTLTSGTACGAVTSAGNMLEQLDPVGNAACYAYDSIHRVTSVTYPSTSTPQKNFVYEAATVNGVSMTNVKTRLAEAYTCTGTCTSKITDLGFSYSAAGQATDIYQSTPHSSGYYHVTSQYWPHGGLNTLSGLSGLPTITYAADPEGRMGTVSASSGQNPVTAVSYNTAGQVTAITFGSADNDVFTFDSISGRLQQYQFKMGSSPVKTDTGVLTWNSNGSLGQLVITDQIYTGGSHTCNYSHDDLGRVASANCGTQSNQTFSYDALGNIKKDATAGISFQPSYDITTNRITSSPFTYTSSNDPQGKYGNLSADSNHTYGWDTAGKMTSVDFGTANAVCLTYDALGRMVEQGRGSSCSSYTEIVYDPSGGKLALMNGQSLVKAFVPLPSGEAVYTSAGLAYYRHQDWLSSSRLATTPSRTMYYDTAYAPFGENYQGSGTMDLSFTGQNQDTVGGGVPGNLYDFLFREDNPAHGRWLSPDPVGLAAVHPTAPQSWNRYAYVGNTPLTSVDPLGLCPIWDSRSNLAHPMFCIPPRPLPPDPDTGGGGGGGGAGSGGQHQGPWPNGETLGLPEGLNRTPFRLAELFGFVPGLNCGEPGFGFVTTGSPSTRRPALECLSLLVVLPAIAFEAAHRGGQSPPTPPAAGTPWTCSFAGVPILSPENCFYFCVPSDGSFGIAGIKPSLDRIKKACPGTTSCPASIEISGEPGSAYTITKCFGKKN